MFEFFWNRWTHKTNCRHHHDEFLPDINAPAAKLESNRIGNANRGLGPTGRYSFQQRFRSFGFNQLGGFCRNNVQQLVEILLRNDAVADCKQGKVLVDAAV